MPARAACHRHPLRARLRPRRPPLVPGESRGRLAALRLARVAKVRWAETRPATNGEPRRGSDQEAAAFIGCGSQAAPPSPRRRAGRAGSGTRALVGSTVPCGEGGCGGRRRPQWRGRVLQQLLLKWRIVRLRVGLVNSEGVRWGRPRGRVSRPDYLLTRPGRVQTWPWPGQSGRSVPARPLGAPFPFLEALSVDSFEFYGSSGRWAPSPLLHLAEADREDWQGKKEGRTPSWLWQATVQDSVEGWGWEESGRVLQGSRDHGAVTYQQKVKSSVTCVSP